MRMSGACERACVVRARDCSGAFWKRSQRARLVAAQSLRRYLGGSCSRGMYAGAGRSRAPVVERGTHERPSQKSEGGEAPRIDGLALLDEELRRAAWGRAVSGGAESRNRQRARAACGRSGVRLGVRRLGGEWPSVRRAWQVRSPMPEMTAEVRACGARRQTRLAFRSRT